MKRKIPKEVQDWLDSIKVVEDVPTSEIKKRNLEFAKEFERRMKAANAKKAKK